MLRCQYPMYCGNPSKKPNTIPNEATNSNGFLIIPTQKPSGIIHQGAEKAVGHIEARGTGRFAHKFGNCAQTGQNSHRQPTITSEGTSLGSLVRTDWESDQHQGTHAKKRPWPSMSTNDESFVVDSDEISGANKNYPPEN